MMSWFFTISHTDGRIDGYFRCGLMFSACQKREIATLKGMVSGQGDLTLGLLRMVSNRSATGSLRLNECVYGSRARVPYSDSLVPFPIVRYNAR